METGYCIGIDLGTTNSALAWVDPREAGDADFPPIHTLPVPQVVAPGRTEELRTLPSFLFLGDQTYVGAYAREQGAVVPTRSVHSAKSWLWNAADGAKKRRSKNTDLLKTKEMIGDVTGKRYTVDFRTVLTVR